MKLSDAFPSKYLKEDDLEGRSVVVTIKLVDSEEVGQSRDQRLVAYFVGKTKGLVLNKTNARKIAEVCGSEDTDDWSGRKIELYPAITQYAGEEVACIRVRAPKSAAAPKPAPLPRDTSDDDDREPVLDEPGSEG